MAAKRRVRVLFAIFYLSFSRSIPLVVVLRWVYELYRFLCGRILFLFAIPLCIFFSAPLPSFALFSASYAALPFLAVIKMSFYMSEGDIWLEDLPGIMLLARACLAL